MFWASCKKLPSHVAYRGLPAQALALLPVRSRGGYSCPSAPSRSRVARHHIVVGGRATAAVVIPPVSCWRTMSASVSCRRYPRRFTGVTARRVAGLLNGAFGIVAPSVIIFGHVFAD